MGERGSYNAALCQLLNTMLIYPHYLQEGMGLQAQLCRPNVDKSLQYRNTQHHVTDLIPVYAFNPPCVTMA